MKFAYVTVIEATDELAARSYAERCLQPGGGKCLMIGGGAAISTARHYYITGPDETVIAAEMLVGLAATPRRRQRKEAP